ncbi:MAG: amidase [Comamonadaceae bacterium PBBC2]|nr:MAG: amidase [Comamonadaceae bacterium PBBC2]
MIPPWPTATDMLSRFRAGEISSSELLEHHIQQIHKLDPAINAVVVRTFEAARERAAAADAARARGEDWGPLHGLPMTVKESFDLPGTPTCWGFPEYKNNIAEQPAVAVKRLLDAGAVVFGKTNVPVALADWQSFNPVYGTTHNPWDLTRTPGGSSGGASAALAAGLTPLELGSDIGASIRNPAHYCGVYGHKPTWGVVPMEGHQLPGVRCIDSLDIAVAGPLARSAQDLQLAMQVLTSPLQLFGPMGWTPAQWRRTDKAPHQCRVAIVFDDPEARVDHSIQNQLHALADFLRSQGVTVLEDHRPVDSAQSHRVYMHLLRAATGAWLDDATYAQFQALAMGSDPAQDSMRERVWRGSTLTHREWVEFDQQRAVLRAQWRAYFETVDLLITPVATSPAFLHQQQGERWDRMLKVNGQDQPHTDSLFWAGYPGVVGLPATAIPIGQSPQGLPVGAQIIGDTLADPLCLKMARWLETEWCGFVPPPHLN